VKPKITKTLTGKMVIKYRCPKCEDKLVSPLDEAGAEDTCPVCSTKFVVPGQAEKTELEKRQEAARDVAPREKLEEAASPANIDNKMSNSGTSPPPSLPPPSPSINRDRTAQLVTEHHKRPLKPTYELTLRSGRTGKLLKRKRIFAADSEAEARRLAEEDGAIVISVLPYSFWTGIYGVAGTSYKNRDNTSRYKVIRSCKRGDRIILEHESGNRHDQNAIRVLDSSGRQMGFLPRETAASIMLWYRSGQSPIYSAIVDKVERWEGGGCPYLRLVVKQPSALEDRIIAALVEDGAQNPTKHLPRQILKSKPKTEFARRKTRTKTEVRRQKSRSGCAVLLTLASILCGVALWCVDCIAS
jgi:uncharacterized Zn finger protein (UPF0148 family)